jgi:hypothetical protein
LADQAADQGRWDSANRYTAISGTYDDWICGWMENFLNGLACSNNGCKQATGNKRSECNQAHTLKEEWETFAWPLTARMTRTNREE